MKPSNHHTAHFCAFVNSKVYNTFVQQKLNMVAETQRSFGTLAARQLWFDIDLPVVPAMREHCQLDFFFSDPDYHLPGSANDNATSKNANKIKK